MMGSYKRLVGLVTDLLFEIADHTEHQEVRKEALLWGTWIPETMWEGTEDIGSLGLGHIGWRIRDPAEAIKRKA